MATLNPNVYFWEEKDPEASDMVLNMPYPRYVTLYNAAMKIAYRQHMGQVDLSGKRYINHPIRVSDACDSARQKVVALLHDVVEDTDYTINDLRNADHIKDYPEIIEAVDALTRRKGESYMDFIRRVSKNGIALCVKIHDLEDNLDCKRIPDMKEEDWSRMKKYYKARKFLLDRYYEHYSLEKTEV